MNVVTIIILSLLIFFAIRALAISLFLILHKIYKAKKVSEEPILTSICFLISFMTIYLYAADIPYIKEKLTNQEWYAFYVIFGGLGIIWSYIQWSVNSFKSLPKWERKDRMAIKKIVIFSIMFIYSVRGGYEQMINSITGSKTDAIYIITNTAIIGCMIAMDRVMNQIHTLYILKREEKEKRKSELQGVN